MILAGLIDVIHWLEDVFERLQLRRSYGGAIAYNYYAPPRLTQDVDVLALVPDIKVPELLGEFSSAGCRHLKPDSRPLELQAVLEDFRSKAHLAAFACRGIRTELFLPWHPFHHRVLQRSPERDLEGRMICISTFIERLSRLASTRLSWPGSTHPGTCSMVRVTVM